MFEGIHAEILSITHLTYIKLGLAWLFIVCPLCWMAIRRMGE